jgi:hypothetical protein
MKTILIILMTFFTFEISSVMAGNSKPIIDSSKGVQVINDEKSAGDITTLPDATVSLSGNRILNLAPVTPKEADFTDHPEGQNGSDVSIAPQTPETADFE